MYNYIVERAEKYKNLNQKMPVICPEHGVFYCRISDHINNKSGCPNCANSISKGELSIIDFLKNKKKY